MKLRRIILALAVSGALFIATTALALAWPDLPPDKATIRGPGIQGTVEIKDKQVLQVLKLGSIEDFEHGYVTAPQVGEGYKITRYFYKGEFDFARLTYYPMTSGRSFLYFEDGPQLQGNHTEYDRQWLYATPNGDAVLKRFLNQLNAAAEAQVAAPNSVASNGGAITSNSPSSVASSAVSFLPSALVVVGGVIGLIGLVGGVLLWTRRRVR